MRATEPGSAGVPDTISFGGSAVPEAPVVSPTEQPDDDPDEGLTPPPDDPDDDGPTTSSDTWGLPGA